MPLGGSPALWRHHNHTGTTTEEGEGSNGQPQRMGSLKRFTHPMTKHLMEETLTERASRSWNTKPKTANLEPGSALGMFAKATMVRSRSTQ